MIQVLRAAKRISVPWKNGGGATREVAIWPPGAGFDTFDWRVSIAEVRADGPFSIFAKIDRTLMILRGSMALEFPERRVALSRCSDPLAFAGEEPCFGIPLDGPVTDLNVMVRRDSYRAEVVRPEGLFAALEADAMLVVATGKCDWHIGEEAGGLETFDAILIDGAREIFLTGAALGVALFKTSD